MTAGEPAVMPPRDHHVVVGAGDTGVAVVRGLCEAGRTVLVVDRDPEALARVARALPGVLSLSLDALDPDMPERCGLSGAAGVALLLPEDKDNLYLAVVARQTASALRVACRCREPERNRRKMLSAGADAVVSPSFIGGMRMASEMVRPHATAFLDLLLHAHDHDVDFSECIIAARVEACGRSIRDAGPPGILFIARRAAGGERFEYNPPDTTRLEAGDTVVLFGRTEALARARASLGG